MGLGNLIKREIAITICTVLLVSTTFLMFSYSIFKVDKEAPADTIKFGDIALRMCVDSKCDENINNLDNVIGIETTTDSNGSIITRHIPIFPTNDPTTAEEWASLKPYTFELTNTGSLDLYVTILLEKDETSLTLTEERKTPSGTTSITYNEQVDDSEVKIGFGEVSATPTIKLYSDTLDSSDNKHKISKNILLKAGETKTYNLYAWLRSDAQNASQGKYFITNITAKGEYLPNGTKALSAKLLEDNPTISTRTDFTNALTTYSANTLYKSTENGTDVYYFSGQDTESTPINNWVKFGKYSSNSSIVRGYYSSTNTSYKEYSTLEECTSATSYNVNCSYAWKIGDDMYWRIIRTNSDGSIKLLYSGTSLDATVGDIGSSKYNSETFGTKYAGYMYGNNDSTLDDIRENTVDSVVKSNVDNWYENNFTTYTNYLSNDAIYCNDRELATGATYSLDNDFNFKTYERLEINKTPTYDCTNSKDAFSVNNPEAKLKYPVAIMSVDEVAFAGGINNKTIPMWYFINGNFEFYHGNAGFLVMSARRYASDLEWVDIYSVNITSWLSGMTADSWAFIRPAVSLKSCVQWKSGDGSASNPYEIVENGGC